MFEQLPFDVVTLLCREVFAQSQDPAHRFPGKQVIGRRVVDTSAYAGHDPLIALSSVSKRTRDAAEPFLFHSIAFGRTWERIGTDRWEVAQRRMLHMLSKSSLRRLVKVFKFECSADAPWDEMKQHRTRFWDTFAKVLKHLRSVETVHLGLFTQELDSCPRIFALPSPRYSAGGDDAFDDQVVQSEWAERGLLGSCIPCASEDTVIALDYELLPLQGVESLMFPNVKTVHLYRSSQWFARHCPNLENYVDCGYTHEREFLMLGQLVLRPSLVRCLKLREGFSPHLLRELAMFSALEELSVWIPPGREVWCNSTTVELSRLTNIRRLCLVKPSSRSLYSSGGKDLQDLVERSIISLEQECSSLLYLKVGEFEYVREHGEESFVMKNLVAS